MYYGASVVRGQSIPVILISLHSFPVLLYCSSLCFRIFLLHISSVAFYIFQSYLVQVIFICHVTRKMAVSIRGGEGCEAVPDGERGCNGEIDRQRVDSATFNKVRL